MRVHQAGESHGRTPPPWPTRLGAWASQKIHRHRVTRSRRRAADRSTTDPEAQLYKKPRSRSRLEYLGHFLMEQLYSARTHAATLSSR